MSLKYEPSSEQVMSALGGKWKELMPAAKDVYTKAAEAGKAALL